MLIVGPDVCNFNDINSSDFECGNCYSYAIGAKRLNSVNLGSLRLPYDTNADNYRLLSKDGLVDLLDRDGWIKIDKSKIEPQKMHIIAVFGYRPFGLDFNDFHCFRLHANGTFSEKVGYGLGIRHKNYDEKQKIDLTPHNLTMEFNAMTSRTRFCIQPPLFAGFFKMPEQGLLVHSRHGVPKHNGLIS